MQKVAVLIFLVCVGLPAGAFAQTYSALDGMTPVGLERGSPVLSGLDTLNLYNGSANVTVPLVKIGGRGEAGYTMVASYDAHWDGHGFMSTSPSDGCSEAAPCPMWALELGGRPNAPSSYRPAGIAIRRLGQHIQPVYLDGS